MTGNTLGTSFRVTTFGESHGRCVGCVADGFPAGFKVNFQEIQRQLDLRRPGTSMVTTSRGEADRMEVLSGVVGEVTTGAPVCMIVWNKDVDSKPYEKMVASPRPGHADYPARIKYSGFNDPRGGGRFSGRMTVSFVMAGGLAAQILKHQLNVETVAYTTEIGTVKMRDLHFEMKRDHRYDNDVRCPDADAAERMTQLIMEERRKGDSVGGIIECLSVGLPVGLGEPLFDSLDSNLSRALMTIPAVKGVEFGSGFASTKATGFQNNDPYVLEQGTVRTTSNNSGGILGGLSSGMPLQVRVAFKPPASIAKTQKTVDLDMKKEVELVVHGRHDPCVVPRAVPVVEAVVSMVLLDAALAGGFIPPVLR
jgi:chorismate synthase